jgi:translation initiation factor IF-3
MARKFINNGDRVKVVLRMRGRELSRREMSKLPIFEFIDMMNDVAVAESIPKDEGNRAIVYLKRK